MAKKLDQDQSISRTGFISLIAGHRPVATGGGEQRAKVLETS